jgi:hypothetical protein
MDERRKRKRDEKSKQIEEEIKNDKLKKGDY